MKRPVVGIMEWDQGALLFARVQLAQSVILSENKTYFQVIAPYEYREMF